MPWYKYLKPSRWRSQQAGSTAGKVKPSQPSTPSPDREQESPFMNPTMNESMHVNPLALPTELGPKDSFESPLYKSTEMLAGGH